ncbi:MAG: hypothetical protein Q8K67_11395 [Geothrix sp.]|nr:hypothetical protein [Geothrix sp.]
MLDLLLIPAALLPALPLLAVRRGEHRLHGYLMTATLTLLGVRLLLHPRPLGRFHLALWLAALTVAGATLLMGRLALAWREARSTHSAYPRFHRALGCLTLVGLAITVLVWLLRHRS